MLNVPTIIRVALCAPLRRLFDYYAPHDIKPESLQPGIRVTVPFGSSQRVGLIVALTQETTLASHRLKPIIACLDTTPCLSPTLLALANWAYQYYQHPPGDVFLGCLPTLLRQGKPATYGRKTPIWCSTTTTPSKTLTLNEAQQDAVNTVEKNLSTFHCFLLDGVTGSGKTEVYLHNIAKVLAQGRQALILVPEIGLTPQTVARFAQRFPVPIAVFHSKLTPRERLDAWIAARDGTTPIVIGTRSAAFTPLKQCGIIIVDESHDPSFKQQEGFRYSAKDLLIMRAKLENIPIVLGSATPSFESLHNVQEKRFTRLLLPARAGKSTPPAFDIVDIRNQQLHEGLSDTLLQKMHDTLARREQVLLFLNRRGYAPCFMCHHCGWIAHCDRCNSHMTYHTHRKRLHCHHCDKQQRLPADCPDCQQSTLFPVGLGTQRIEQILQDRFPQYITLRLDKDTTEKKGAFEEQLAHIHNEQCHIIIGTQMLAKGHHFPKVTLVAIVDGDSGFFATDFRATEHMAQLLLQVSGRSGRSDHPGTVVIQTRQPHNLLLQQLIHKGYNDFAKTILQERALAHLPPYGYLALFRAESVQENYPQQFLKDTQQILRQHPSHGVNLRGPIPAPMEKRAGKFRAQLLLQAQHRAPLQQLLRASLPAIEQLKSAKKVRWSLDVDPMEMY
ncbi:MAG: primosomal protein N' [Gammaproteobacteria bacterium]